MTPRIGLVTLLSALGPIISGHALQPAASTPPDFWHQETLTFDWGGLPTVLTNYGITERQRHRRGICQYARRPATRRLV